MILMAVGLSFWKKLAGAGAAYSLLSAAFLQAFFMSAGIRCGEDESAFEKQVSTSRYRGRC
jgi:hypothetical protein